LRILIIEDDPNIVDFLKVILQVGLQGAEIKSTHLGIRGVELARQYHPTIVLLDLGLPDVSGFEVLEEIRKISDVPVVILSVRADETAVVKALGMGADDYVIKPCRQLELIARIQSILRHQEKDSPANKLEYGAMVLDSVLHELDMEGRRINLTRTECTVLGQLMLKRGSIVTVSELSRAIWGSEYGAAESIKVYVYQLRQKLEKNPAKPVLILNKPHAGYYLASCR
jgi:two-component system KDP operon response regulator KdpE